VSPYAFLNRNRRCFVIATTANSRILGEFATERKLRTAKKQRTLYQEVIGAFDMLALVLRKNNGSKLGHGDSSRAIGVLLSQLAGRLYGRQSLCGCKKLR
jgi:hypothetical protein